MTRTSALFLNAHNFLTPAERAPGLYFVDFFHESKVAPTLLRNRRFYEDCFLLFFFEAKVNRLDGEAASLRTIHFEKKKQLDHEVAGWKYQVITN